MPDPITLLKEDHKKVKDLFAQFEKADGRSKQRIVNEALMELEVHAAIEEEIFYPGVAKATGEEIMAEAEEEHHVAKVLMAEIRECDPSDVHYDAKFMVLSENVKH
ncbi:MAG: hemerythrin domain-containing protein, partial [Dehalococcoidia bacterium]